MTTGDVTNELPFELMTDENLNDFVFSHIRAALDGVDDSKRDAAWLKASILLNGLYKKDPIETLSLLQRLKHVDAQDNKAEFESFRSEFSKLTYPLTLSEHGYLRSLASWDQAEAWKHISDAEVMLASLGYKAFINSGTLLGAIREGALLAHDDDADLGVILNGDTVQEIVADWFVLKKKLDAVGRLALWYECYDAHHSKLTGDLPIDLFPCWCLNGEFFAWPHGKTAIENVTPLKECRIEGVTVHTPAVPELLLEIAYGPTWRIPDRAFRYSWATSYGDAFKDFREEFDRQKPAADL